MIIVFWIALVGILAITGYFIWLIVQIKIKPRWGLVPSNHLHKKEITIPVEDGELKGYFYTSADFEGSDKMPGVIVLPRRDKKYPFFEHWGAHFALQGFPTLCIETYDKKSTISEFISRMVAGYPNIKKTFLTNPQVRPDELAIFGQGDSAEAAVYIGANDADVKVICAAGMHKLNEKKAESAKDKVFIVHSKDDNVVTMDEFNANVQLLGLSEKDYLLLDLGGHYFNSQEAVIGGFFSIKLHGKLNPEYKQVTRKDLEVEI
jgi:dienelactone hydrolase